LTPSTPRNIRQLSRRQPRRVDPALPGGSNHRSEWRGSRHSRPRPGSDFTRVRTNGLETCRPPADRDSGTSPNRGRGFDFNTSALRPLPVIERAEGRLSGGDRRRIARRDRSISPPANPWPQHAPDRTVGQAASYEKRRPASTIRPRRPYTPIQFFDHRSAFRVGGVEQRATAPTTLLETKPGGSTMPIADRCSPLRQRRRTIFIVTRRLRCPPTGSLCSGLDRRLCRAQPITNALACAASQARTRRLRADHSPAGRNHHRHQSPAPASLRPPRQAGAGG